MFSYIVTVTAADRVGIVHSVTGTIAAEGGNILELSQTVMRDYFTIILAVEFPRKLDRETLTRQLADRGKRFDLTVSVIEIPSGPHQAVLPNADRFILTVLGDDHAGNIHGISSILAAHGVNIVDLHARTEGKRFSLVMEAFLPPDLTPVQVRQQLESYGRDLGLEAFVQHENIFLATSEPSPVRVGPALKTQGAADVPH